MFLLRIFFGNVGEWKRISIQTRKCDYMADFIIWVSRNYYSPEEFIREAQTYGVSRRISKKIPTSGIEKGSRMFFAFEAEKDYTARVEKRITIGKHKKGERPVKNLKIIGMAYMDDIQYIADGTETAAELQYMKDRGVSIVEYKDILSEPVRGCGHRKAKAVYMTAGVKTPVKQAGDIQKTLNVKGGFVTFNRRITYKSKAWRGWKRIEKPEGDTMKKSGLRM